MVLGTMVAIVRQHDSPICGGVKEKTTRNCGGIAVRYSLIFAYICHIAALRKDRKSTRLNSSHRCISYAVFCLKKKKKHQLLLHGRLNFQQFDTKTATPKSFNCVS